MRAGVVEAAERGRQNAGQRGEAQDRERDHQDGEDRHLDVLGLDLLAEILGRTADHQPGDEHCQHGEQQDAVEAGADAAEDDLAELDVEQRHQPAERRVAVMHRVDRPVRGVGGGDRPDRRVGDAEADLLALHIAAGL